MNSLELFSGAGGLAKGLELAGFSHAAFVEYNKHACASLRQNFQADKVFFGDIRDFDFKKLNQIDVVAGGPPCQPFSLGGKHQAYDDDRDMFPHAIKAIEELAPKAFIFENVKGLLRPSFADYFEYILLRLTYPDQKAKPHQDWRDHLADLKRSTPKNQKGQRGHGLQYDVNYKLINAADYGVPQTRERVLIVGLRSDLGLTWSFPQPTHSEDRLRWEMVVSGDYWHQHGLPRPVTQADTALQTRYGFFEPEGLPWRTVRDVIKDMPDPRENHAIADHLFKDGARSYPGHTGSDLDWPAKTIKAGGHGVPGGENMIRYPDGGLRYFTVFEAKRIQTFPDDFRIAGAWGEAMRQIGNAVPVSLGACLGRQLAKTLANT
jgi:DNA (cytosine-5)-methyltransferase 1